MSLFLGAGDRRLAEKGRDGLERCAAALGHYPSVGGLRRHIDDVCFLAHAQRIVTPEDRLERQPSRHGDGRFVLAMDGWLANRAELVRDQDLAAGGLGSDSSIVAAALMHWGDAALDRLHGDFTFAWWDRAERRLLLACDRVGGRTLFYHEAGGRLLFANVLAVLFAHPEVPRTLDPDMVARAAFPQTFDLERTCFRDVRQLLPSHKLVWTPDGMRVERYWRPDPHRRIRFRRDEDYVEAARELLDRVVGEALRADGPVVAMLSGGLDSSGVAATAARLTAPAPLHTITLRPDPGSPLPPCGERRFQDEWPHAQAVAALHPTMVAHAEPARFEPIENVLRAHMNLTGRPPVHLMASTWMEGVWHASRRLGAVAVLSGLSGNATLSATAVPSMLRPGPADLPAALSDAVLRLRLGDRPAAIGLLKSLAPGWLRDARRRMRGALPPWQIDSALRPEAAERIDMDATWHAFEIGDRDAPWHSRARIRRMERTWAARTLIAPLRLIRAEGRDPLGDIRLAQFCLAIPPNQFTRPGHDRFLARRVLADRLPPPVAEERRIGVQGAEWFDWLTRSRAWLAAELDGIEASALGREMIDVPRLRAILDDWPTDAAAAAPHYVPLMAVLGRGVGLGSFIRWAEGGNR